MEDTDALQRFVANVEAKHFRTDGDTGANHNALFIWNQVREYAGLPRLTMEDLPAYCIVHRKYHVIREDYECKRRNQS